jgi:transcriptional regulator with XRE-family HTH domain
MMPRASYNSRARHSRKREFSTRINEQLRRLGWSVRQAARAAAVQENRMFRFNLGLSLPGRPTLLRIAEAFGVEPATLAPWETGR